MRTTVRLLTVATVLVISQMFTLGLHAQGVPNKEQLVKMLQNRATALSSETISRKQQNRIIVEEAQKAGVTSAADRKKLAGIARQEDTGKVDLEIFFAYDSANVAPSALKPLITLGQALADKRLSSGIFLIAGHTDARGSDVYNLNLSRARAEAVKKFLVDNFNLAPKRLVAVGYGEEELKIPSNPASGTNRRVQIVNLSN